MKALSLFSGVECIGLGFLEAGFEIVAHCEIDRFARSVLRFHWPDHPIMEDVEDVEHPPPADVVFFGSPCQDWSVAGRGEGLGGDRARLFREGVRLADRASLSGGPAWMVFENVFSLVLDRRFSGDFADVLGEVTGFRPDPPERWGSAGVCVGPKRSAVWRVLDAQYFGVPQRRRRLVVVANPGRVPALEVLFEPGCLQRNPASSEEAGTIASALTAPSSGGCRLDDGELNGRVVSERVVGALTRNLAHGTDDNDARQGKIVYDAAQITSPDNRSNPNPEDPSGTLSTRSNLFLIEGDSAASTPDLPRLRRGCGRGGETAVVDELARVRPRRLTPLECERLQGLPDHWTRFGINDKGRKVALTDTRRYKLIGNGAAVPQFAWIARRLYDAMRATDEGGRP